MRVWGAIERRAARRTFRLPSVALPLLDQALISAGTFAFNVVLARAIPLGAYGRFAMMAGIFSLMQACCASLVFYPLAVRGAAACEERRDRLIASAILLTLIVSLPLAAVLAGGIRAFIDDALFLPSFAVMFAGQVQEAMRRSLLTQFRHAAALPGDALSYLGQCVLLVVVCRSVTATLETALWVMAATSLASAAVQSCQLRLRGACPLPLAGLTADFWTVGHWSLTSNLLGIVRGQGVPWLLTALTGAPSAGAFQIAMNLVNVVNPIISGVCNLVPQLAARALRSGYREAWSASRPAICAGAVLVTGFVVIIIVAPSNILSAVYGTRVQPSLLIGPMRILALAALLAYVSSAACAYLHGVLGGRDVLVTDVITTLTAIIAGPLLVTRYGLEGGCATLALTSSVRVVGLVYCTMARVLGPGHDRVDQFVPNQETSI